MKVTYNSETKKIEISIGGPTTMTESLDPDEALVVADILRTTANILGKGSSPINSGCHLLS